MKLNSYEQKIYDMYEKLLKDPTVTASDRRDEVAKRIKGVSTVKVWQVIRKHDEFEECKTKYGKFTIAELNLPYSVYYLCVKYGMYKIIELMDFTKEFWDMYFILGMRMYNLTKKAINDWIIENGYNPDSIRDILSEDYREYLKTKKKKRR